MDSVNSRFGHVAAVWRDMTLVFGGSRYEGPHATGWTPYDPATIHCHKNGNWTIKVTTGAIPSIYDEAAHVIGDNLYVVKSYAIHKLNLTTFVWSKIVPRGTGPLACSTFTSWVRGEKIFLFGGAGHDREEGVQYPSSLTTSRAFGLVFTNNQLLYYDCKDNSWNWPVSYGDIPSPRGGAAAFSVLDTCVKSEGRVTSMKSFAFVMGGSTNSKYHYDLYILDMDSMTWKSIKGHVTEMWPSARRHHSLTLMSREYAVLYGGHCKERGHLGDCWLLDIRKCTSEMNPENMWTLCKTVGFNGRSKHAAIREPISKSLWIVGGTINGSLHTSQHILEMSYNADKTLQALAIASAAKNICRLQSRIDKLPNVIRLAIKREVQRERNPRSWLRSITMQEK